MDSSNQYSISEFNDLSKSHTQSLFSVLHINCRSLNRNYSEIEATLNQIKCQFKIIALTETWLNSNTLPQYMFNGYTFVGSERGRKRGGGVGLCIHNQLNFKIRQDLIFPVNVCESFFIEISKPGKNLLVGVCYRPPNQSVQEFNEKLGESLNLIDRERKDCIVLGDFNIDLNKVDSCNFASEFLETFVLYSYEPLINNCTRITETSRSLIDNIFVNSACNFSSGTIVCDISDHFPVFSFLTYSFTLRSESNYIDKRIINEENICLFLQKLDEVDFETIFSVDRISSTEPNAVYDKLVDIVLDVYNQCFPYKRVCIKQ